MKKVKYWWVQYIPVLGMVLVFLFFKNEKWDDNGNESLGSNIDFNLSAMIQAISFCGVMAYLIFKYLI